MSELHIGPHRKGGGEVPAEGHPPHEMAGTFDREINLRAIFWLVAGLLVVAVVVHIAMWWMGVGFIRFEAGREPRPVPITRAHAQAPPPEPRLQVAPQEDMRQMRVEEDLLLHQPGWVDEAQGTARIPIDIAMEVIAARGAGQAAAVAAEPEAAPPQPRERR